MYDVIVVGARVAGSSTAMLLARQGYRVLVLDQAAFPSDTLSTHQVQTPGVACLAEWGLLDRVGAAGTPAARQLRFDVGPVVLSGRFPAYKGVDAVYSPRRTVLDHILVEAAREAGAEVREKYMVEEVVHEDGRVIGVRGRAKGGASTIESARLVVGADGKHSMVAAGVGAALYGHQPALTVAAYTYWEGVPLAGGEIYSRPDFAAGAWPTNDGLTMTFVSWPIARFAGIRGDLERSLLSALDRAGDLGGRVRGGRRAEKIRATTDTPNFFRKANGPGWVLVGDAGLVMDPTSGQGISHAFVEADIVAAAIVQGFEGRLPMDVALEGYARERDLLMRPMFEFTTQLASFKPPALEAEILFSALANRPGEVSNFFGVLTGSTPMPDYFSLRNLLRVIGPGGMARIVAGKLRASRSGPSALLPGRALQQ